ncbi:MAG: kelch repeat-containing protein [Microcoleaceae cyanobacterium]
MVTISNATAVEGLDQYLVFNLSLSESLPLSQLLTLELGTEEGTARGGPRNEFNRSRGNNPIDFADQNFEFSLDQGETWLPAENNAVSFGFGQQALLVRIEINDDRAAEGFTPETMSLRINEVLSGNPPPNLDLTDIGTGFIEDNDNRRQPINVVISDTTVTEGEDEYIVWDVGLSSSSGRRTILKLEARGRSAKGGSIGDLLVEDDREIDLEEENLEVSIDRPQAIELEEENLEVINDRDTYAIDFDDRDFEFSNDGGRTWRRIPNRNAAIPTGFATGLTKIRTRLIDDDIPENTESVELRVGDIEEGIVDNSSSVGVATILDNDFAAIVSTTYQAEDATLMGPVVLSGRGSQGTGYADYQNLTGDYIEWTVDGGNGGTYDLSWRYANGSSSSPNRPLELNINGVTELASLNFPATGGWSTWDLVTESVELNPGNNTIRLTAIGSSGANFDWLEVAGPTSSGDSCIPISTLPCTDVRVEGDRIFNFDGADGGLSDQNGDDIGFTMVDPASNAGNPNPPLNSIVGYWPEKLDVTNGVLQITTTAGIQFDDNNSQDNALGVGLNVPSQAINLDTTLVNLPTAAGGFSQAGLWFGQALDGGSGSSEDNYIKLVVISPTPGDYQLQALMEQDGIPVQSTIVDIPDNPNSVALNLFIDPETQTVAARYILDNGTEQNVATFTQIPQEWFSFDQAGINPEIATRSFGGIFATNRNSAASQVYSFEEFSVTESDGGVLGDPLPFDRWSVPVNNPTAMDVGPDGRLYVATLFGDIFAFTLDPDTRSFTSELIDTIPNSEGAGRLTLGLAVDPDSTANDVTLWVAHSNGAVSNGALNSGKISRLSGPGFSQKEDVITQLPRAIANHATNNIDFGPDGRLYIWQGGNTGAGSANNEPTEFGDRPEQVLSAAVLVADVKDPNFNGTTGSNIGEFVEQFYTRTSSDVEIYASGLRNTYDGVFHSNGNLYAPDNGLGVTGTVPPVPRLGDPTDRNITTLFGQVPVDNPGKQIDPLNRIVQGGYYGHPNPYLDEVVFKDGSFQGFNNSNTPPGHPNYDQPFFNLGVNRSANGIIEYTADNFFGELQGDLLINNFSQGDNITRIELSSNGLSVNDSSTLSAGFVDPLPLAMGPNGSIFVGEFNGNRITILEPIGTWREDLPPVPADILDPGSAVVDGKLYLVGGKNANTHVSTVSVYDPGDPFDETDDVWSTAPNLPGAAVENPAVVSFNGDLYVFGGSTAPFSGAVDNAAVFDPDTASWSTLTDMPTPRGGATAQVLNGEIYVIGGLGANGASVDTVEIFDPVTGQWSSGTDLQTRRDNPGSAVVDDMLYVFGGRTRNSDGFVENDTLNTIEIYDPVSNLWSFGTPMPTGRRALSVGTLNNRIQVIGGEAGVGGTSFEQNEEYNPATDTWRTLPSIPTPRHGAGFGTIDDVVYVVGGGPAAGSNFTNVTEGFTL